MSVERVSQFTKNLMSRFPTWMKMAKDESSVGAQFLDVFGTTLELFKKEMDSIVNDFYIGSARIDMIDIIYKTPLAQETILDMEENYIAEIENHDNTIENLEISETLRDFYAYEDKSGGTKLNRAFLDKASGYMYVRVNLDEYEDIQNPFKAVKINFTNQYKLEIHHVWNAFDEFGLLLGVYRLEGERNLQYKERILDVLKNKGNSTKDGMINGISRELGILPSEVTIKSLSDSVFDGTLLNKDGTPTKKMMSYSEQINSTLKFTFDKMNFSTAYWHSIEDNNMGIHYLPHIWDIGLDDFTEDMFQSGVGGEEDLLVHAPVAQSEKRNFRAYIGLMGFYEEVEEIYPEISFRYKIYAKGMVPNKEYKQEPFKYMIKASPIVEQQYQVSAEQEFNYAHRNDFFDRNKFINDDKTVFGKSNDLLHTQEDNIFKLSVRMSTTNENDSPSISDFNIVYENLLGEEKRFALTTQDDWLNDKSSTTGTPLTIVNYSDISADEEKMELGRGAFQRIFDTTADFQGGSYETNAVLINNGVIELNRDLTGKIRN